MALSVAPCVGHPGRALLSGRDDGAMLLVSYNDLRTVLERSFGEVTAAADAQQTQM